MPRDKTRQSRRKPRGPASKPEPTEPEYEQSYYQEPQPQPTSYSNNENNNGARPLYIDPAAFGAVEPDVQHYFKNLEKAIDSKNPEDENNIEDLNLFIENAFDEITSKEFTLVVDKECSRVLEKLLCLAPDYRVISLMAVLVDKILTLITHRFASHVCQSILVLSAKIIQKEVQGIQISIPEDKKDSIDTLPSMTDLLLSITDALQGHWSELIFNPFASHYLRVLLQVLHGSPFETGTKSLVRSKSSKKYMASKSGGSFSPIVLKGSHLVPDSFHRTLSVITNELVLNLPDVVIRSSVLHHTASPLFQALLLIKAAEKSSSAIDEFVNKLLLGIPSESEIISDVDNLRNPFVLSMIRDSVGSHLFEIILKTISDELFHRIYLLYFRSKMVDLSVHHVSNFIVQELLVNARSPVQLQLMLEELTPEFGRFLRINRPGILRSLVEGCLKLNSGYKEVMKNISKAFFKNVPEKQNEFIHLILLMQDYENYQNCKPEGKPKYHEQGSLLLQKLLHFPDPHNSPVINSFLAQTSTTFLDLARDKVACHVIEKLLTSPEVSLKVKRKTLKIFEDSYHLLATDVVGSRVLDKCWAVADISTKERIAVELVQHESLLSSNFYGRFVLKNCRIEHFKRKRAEWKAGEESSDRKKDMFQDILGDDVMIPTKKPVSKPHEAVDPKTLNILGFNHSAKGNSDGELSDEESKKEVDEIFSYAFKIDVNPSQPTEPQPSETQAVPEVTKKVSKKKKKADKEGLEMVLNALKTGKRKDADPVSEPKSKKEKKEKKEKKAKKEKKSDEALKSLILEGQRKATKAPKKFMS